MNDRAEYILIMALTLLTYLQVFYLITLQFVHKAQCEYIYKKYTIAFNTFSLKSITQSLINKVCIFFGIQNYFQKYTIISLCVYA